MRLDDRLFDLVEERIDIGIYLGRLPDNTYVMRKLADNQRILVATPAYLDRHGRPQTPDDLHDHICLRWHDGREPWLLEGRPGEFAEIETRSRLRSNNGDVIQAWARAGLGIMFKSRIDLLEDLAAGRLERVLPSWQSTDAPVCALMPSRRHLATKAQVFLDALARRLA